MFCAGCAHTVKDALRSVPGVEQVYVNLGGGTAEVVYDPDQADVVRMMGAVAAAGYEAAPRELRPASRANRQRSKTMLTRVVARDSDPRRHCRRRRAARALPGDPQHRPVAEPCAGAIEPGRLVRRPRSRPALGFRSGCSSICGPTSRASTSAAVPAGSGAMSTAAMAACCAHHLIDVLPFLGLTRRGRFPGPVPGLDHVGGPAHDGLWHRVHGLHHSQSQRRRVRSRTCRRSGLGAIGRRARSIGDYTSYAHQVIPCDYRAFLARPRRDRLFCRSGRAAGAFVGARDDCDCLVCAGGSPSRADRRRRLLRRERLQERSLARLPRRPLPRAPPSRVLLSRGRLPRGRRLRTQAARPQGRPSLYLRNVRQDAQASVTVEVTPAGGTSGTLIFDVSMNTHSVELGYDMTKIATLTDDQGRNYPAKSWDGAAGGHHREGSLTLRGPDWRGAEVARAEPGRHRRRAEPAVQMGCEVGSLA